MRGYKIKSLKEIYQPDSRCFFIAPSLERHYQLISRLILHSKVPNEVRGHYNVARNLLLYSWFVYDFIPVAEMHAYSSLEFALRMRMGSLIDQNHPPGIKYLLNYVISHGWIKNRDFEQWRRIELRRRNTEELWSQLKEIAPGFQVSNEPSDYVKILLKGIPYFRNQLAHGSTYISPHGYLTLEICRDFINPLFKKEFHNHSNINK